MTFNREWSLEIEDYIINRDRTGPPPPPSTGTTVAETGAVVADSATVAIAPSKIVKVTIPGPRERVIDTNGLMTQPWRRFFEELYRRTGYLEDNVNNLTDRDLGGDTAAAVSVAFTGNAPTLARSWAVFPGAASVGITPNAVSLHGVMQPDTVSISLAGIAPTATVA